MISDTVDSISEVLLNKELTLKEHLAGYESLAVAYSGGVDSAYLSEVAFEVLGGRTRMVLADSPSIPRSELAEAVRLAEQRKWPLTILKTGEFENENYLKNDGRRCYFCKSELFAQMDKYAKSQGVRVLAYGENADDSLDPTRAGSQAAREHQVVAPLAQLGFHKPEIRELSRHRGLPTWNKASFACLASRFPVGTRVDAGEMQKVEQAEEVLKSLGFRQYRARHHGSVCRIEVDPGEFERILAPETREKLIRYITLAGYAHVSLDLAGYRTGSTAAPPDAPATGTV